ncbi:hypothetical protein [Corynebacterium sp. AOP12-C2-36]|uniref:hypothetical protein n=1 Tax=Corynebacterium sp. AOP12-C2-36 TaxID=3457723 RepID=UPI0040332456
MTSEKELRQIAADQLRASRLHLADDVALVITDGLDGLEDHDLEQVAEMVSTWPIPELPLGDRHGYWWPKHGRNYGYVSGHVPLTRGGGLRHGEWEVVIGRGSGYIRLTPAEAEELASLLLAAAHHERNQE